MKIKGISASGGIAMGYAKYFVKEKVDISKNLISDSEKAANIEKVEKAFAEYKEELDSRTGQSEIEAGVTEAHKELLSDPFFIDTVKEKIDGENKPSDMALDETVELMASMMEALDDPYLRERGADYRDIGSNLLYKLKGIETESLENLSRPSIIVSDELTPSDTAKMDKEKVIGLANDFGGATSHTSIIAQTLGIPCLVGMKEVTAKVKDGDYLIIDAEEGYLYINPEQELIDSYKKSLDKLEEEKARLKELKFKEAISKDGRKVEIVTNIGNLEDLNIGIEAGAEGVGLFRTEFLYMDNSHFPTEEEQFKVYKEAAEKLQGKPLIIRTLDIGGDKALSYFEFPHEENPFLGWRALRICFDMPEIFSAQLKAILRASVFGNIKILLPMIISLDELLRVNEILDGAKAELKKENIDFNPDIEVGIMIETPASVFSANDLAKHCDFFSIGTNDLTQYVLAADRGNEKVAKLYNSFNPAVLRAIGHVIKCAHDEGIWCGMCGGFAGDHKATYLLFGLGLDEFSAPASKLTKIKDIIINSDYSEAKKFAHDILETASLKEVLEKIEANAHR